MQDEGCNLPNYGLQKLEVMGREGTDRCERAVRHTGTDAVRGRCSHGQMEVPALWSCRCGQDRVQAWTMMVDAVRPGADKSMPMWWPMGEAL
jgi:hypothetical protein